MQANLDDDIVHATTVAIGGIGVLILGPSGSGKSALALQLMALGAKLVADDQTCLEATDTQVIASPAASLQGLIEARGIGILRAPYLASAPLGLTIDLARQEVERLPPLRNIVIKGHAIDLVFGQQNAHFPASLLCRVLGGRHA